MRIATFNAENLFSRVRAMNLATWADGKPILYEYSRLNARLQKASYTVSDKLKILESIAALDLTADDESRFVILRQNRGHLLKRSQGGRWKSSPTGAATGSAGWN